jgi:hypothetical protein
MRLIAPAIVCCTLIAASATGCGGSKYGGTATSRAISRSPTVTSGPSTRPAGGSPTVEAGVTATGNGEEVSGIVGTVSASTRTIQIDRRSGATVTKITVLPTTSIRSAAGDTLSLSSIRPSDRIVARGSLNDQRDAIVATEITISQAVPGSAPGGG